MDYNDEDTSYIEELEEKKTKIRYIKKSAQQLVSDVGSDVPIILRDIIKKVQEQKKISINCKPMDLSNKFSGQIVIYGNAVGIIYNENHSRNRQRFTVAHELGHLILGHEFKIKQYNEIIKFNTKSPIEREANIFAAELLMPKNILTKYLKENKITSVSDLSIKFEVSEEALWFKISSDNLMKHFTY